MTSIKKDSTIAKSRKKVYESVKLMNCTRCGIETGHTLFDYDIKLYKCNVCGAIHAKNGK